VLALGAAYSAPVAADGSIGHRIAGAAGWAGNDHVKNALVFVAPQTRASLADQLIYRVFSTLRSRE
jgi:hypothetical protein